MLDISVDVDLASSRSSWCSALLVDDAIVVGENVYTHQQHGEDPLASAISGTQEVSVPVIFGVLTTIVAFGPMLLIGGRMGQIFGVIAAVVILCLIFSLIESQLILPAHLGHGSGGKGEEHRGFAAFWVRFQGKFGDAFERFTHDYYAAWLARAIHWRYTTVSIGVALLLCAMAMVASGRMNFSFFPDLQANFVSARISMPRGTPVETTERSETAQIVDALVALAESRAGSRVRGPEHESLDQARDVDASGSSPCKRRRRARTPLRRARSPPSGSHLGEVTIELVAAEQRSIPTDRDHRRPLARAHWARSQGSEELTFSSALFSIGDAMNFQLQGHDVETLQAAADRIKAKLATYPGHLRHQRLVPTLASERSSWQSSPRPRRWGSA